MPVRIRLQVYCGADREIINMLPIRPDLVGRMAKLGATE
jgi:hypothetical protein